MANLNTAQFTLTDMTTKRSLGERLESRWITVKDFGAVGDGETDDTQAIQDTFDYAFGTEADPHGSVDFGNPVWGGVEQHTNKTVFFPAGNYKVSETLQLNLVKGGAIEGAGSYQSRIFFDPEADEHIPADSVDYQSPGQTISSLLDCRMCWNLSMKGITLDAGGVQQVVMRANSWPPTWTASPFYADDGSGGLYTDVHLTNATFDGFLSGGTNMGSERTWVNCRFTNCKWGHLLSNGNALNHSFYNCLFADNEQGAVQQQGGAATFFNCRFENNSVIDVNHSQATVRLAGCHSTSQNFLQVSGVVNCCSHDAAVEGYFYTPAYFHGGQHTDIMPLPGALDVNGSDTTAIAMKGNHVTNGILFSQGVTGVHLVGNIFDNPDYLTTFGLASSTKVFEDGVLISP